MNPRIRVRVPPTTPRRFTKFRDQSKQSILKCKNNQFDNCAINIVEDITG